MPAAHERWRSTNARLLRLNADERRPSESTEAKFQRVDVARIMALLAELTVLASDSRAADDFISLGESHALTPETLEGESSA